MAKRHRRAIDMKRIAASLSALTLAFCAIAPNATAEMDCILVANHNVDEIVRFDRTTGAFIDVFIAAGSGGIDEPHGILVRETDILITSFVTHEVLRYDRNTGAFIDVFIDGSTGIASPVYTLQLPGGDLIITSQGNDSVLRFDSDGNLIGPFVTSGAGGLDGPSGQSFGADGRLYVASRYTGEVIAYDGVTGAFDEVIAGPADGLTPGTTFGIQGAPSGDIYVASGGDVHRIDPIAGTVTSTTPLSFAIGIEISPDDEVIAAEAGSLFRINNDATSTGPLLSGYAIPLLNFFTHATFPDPCAADLDGDGSVGASDLATLIGQWGMTDVPADLDGAGVGASDLAQLIGLWGPCL